jgi:hypothetical protein
MASPTSDPGEIDDAEARARAQVLFEQRVPSHCRWKLTEVREGKLQTRMGSYRGWFVTYKRRPDKGEERDWRTTDGIGVFVHGDTGKAEMVR